MISIEQTPEPAQESAPEEGLIEAEEVSRVERALATLDPAKRAILELRAVEGLSYAEIAEALGCAVGTVMSRLCRARIELRERLGLEASRARVAR